MASLARVNKTSTRTEAESAMTLASLRKRRPRRCSSDRSATSGRVSTRRLPFITAVTATEVGCGYGSRLGDEPECGGLAMVGNVSVGSVFEGMPYRRSYVTRKRRGDSVSNLPELLA